MWLSGEGSLAGGVCGGMMILMARLISLEFVGLFCSVKNLLMVGEEEAVYA